MDITVVVPAYQAASTVGVTLASAAAQDHPPSEVLVVDDGSTDGTAEVVAEWADLLPLRVIRHNRNQGQAAALRTGIAAAASPVVARLDADDVWLPDHLGTLARLFERSGGLITADSWNWVPGEALADRSWYEKHPVPGLGRGLVALARDNWVFGSVLFDRADHDRVGGFRHLPACEDWDLWLRMLDAGIPVTAAPNVTMLYRQRLGSVSRGERSLLAGAQLLQDFSENGSDPEARAVAAATGRELRRRAALHRAYDLVRAGSSTSARRHAITALRGARTTSVRAVAVMLAPKIAVQVYDRLQSDARRRVAA